MRTITIILSLAISLFCFSQSPQSFEGFIKYKISFNFDESYQYTDYTKQKYGDEMIMYFNEKGSYRKEYKNSGARGFDYIIYDVATNNSYAKFRNLDTLYYYNASENSLTHKAFEQGKNAKILKEKCSSIIVQGVDPQGNETIRSTYFFSGKPFINPDTYRAHKDFFYDEVMNRMQSPYLKLIMDFEGYSIVFEAVQITTSQLDGNLFVCPDSVPTKQL